MPKENATSKSRTNSRNMKKTPSKSKLKGSDLNGVFKPNGIHLIIVLNFLKSWSNGCCLYNYFELQKVSP